MAILLLLLLDFTDCFQTDDITNVTSYIIDNNCAFNGLNGINSFCGKNLQKSTKFPAILGTGWDPVTGQIMLPFLELTYRNNNMYTTPIGSIFMIPDQTSISLYQQTDVTTNIYQTADDYFDNVNPTRTNILSGSLGIPINEMANIIPLFDNGNNNIVDVIEYNYIYNMILSEQSDIIPELKELLESLPDVYTYEYDMIIENWGTHVITSGYAGGLANQMVLSKNCFSGADLVGQSELTFLKTSNPTQYQNVDYQANFNLYSTASIFDMYGGDPSIMNWQDRIQTLYDNPVMINFQVLPLTAFISNATIRNIMQQVVNNYLTNGINQINQYKQNYYNGVNLPKQLMYLSVMHFSAYNNYPEEYVITANQLDFNLASGSSQPVQYGNAEYSNAICQRNSIGYISSGIYNTNNTPPGFCYVNNQNGNSVRFGCSYNSYVVTRCNTPPHPSLISQMGFCCMGCEPAIINSNGKMLYTGCNCPKMIN